MRSGRVRVERQWHPGRGEDHDAVDVDRQQVAGTRRGRAVEAPAGQVERAAQHDVGRERPGGVGLDEADAVDVTVGRRGRTPGTLDEDVTTRGETGTRDRHLLSGQEAGGRGDRHGGHRRVRGRPQPADRAPSARPAGPRVRRPAWRSRPATSPQVSARVGRSATPGADPDPDGDAPAPVAAGAHVTTQSALTASARRKPCRMCQPPWSIPGGAYGRNRPDTRIPGPDGRDQWSARSKTPRTSAGMDDPANRSGWWCSADHSATGSGLAAARSSSAPISPCSS